VVEKVVVDTSVLIDALEEGDEELLTALVEREVLVPYVARARHASLASRAPASRKILAFAALSPWRAGSLAR
jgi:predicted nucleic acid-binding protein